MKIRLGFPHSYPRRSIKNIFKKFKNTSNLWSINHDLINVGP